ncbi:hypothetical protein IG195_20270 (plasmid) [Arthrobacter sp. TES]|uniref:hypothetical protein n=1 Tax=Paenarthrobacter sp. NCHU4564 TaxID=3451353 RepID=UPI000397E560|nr:hypothetical protein ARZXY2_4399 [Arthrobacter sp. ZXY-2]ERI38098.1 hypothetical protein M707_08570 [Arthrobacter sp. AK-YN10]QOI65717.1 hypothetical protein IG195_20270 [Arthrobacter sp. TES]
MRELAAPGAVRRFFPFNIRGRTNQIRESYGRDLLEDSGASVPKVRAEVRDRSLIAVRALVATEKMEQLSFHLSFAR